MIKLNKKNGLEIYDRLIELGYNEIEALILVKNSPTKALEIIEQYTCECGEPLIDDYWPKKDIEIMKIKKSEWYLY